MHVVNILILILCVAATLGWCVFVWVTSGGSAWRRPLGGAFVIAAAGAVATSILGHHPLAETLVMAIVCGASAAAIIGAIQFGIWIRDKGAERRDRKAYDKILH